MEIHYFESLPSTNRTAAEAARSGAGELYTVVAKSQTAGRGRMERSFFSPVGGTYFSTVLRPAFGFDLFSEITPMAAVAVHKAIAHVCGVVTEIKWVNDLLWRGKKVCGILAESGTDQNGIPYVVLGIGINTAEVAFPPELCESAGVVPCKDNVALIGAILAELSQYERAVTERGWHSYYKQHCHCIGHIVEVIRCGNIRPAFVHDVLPDGGLKVQYEDGSIEVLRGGEITLRKTAI
ncbi:MAG: biotin--[Clostridia bacterium]|nr:biotin--[acetyl-CoA-carboxylase] ligase [Clostridia bacterium]